MILEDNFHQKVRRLAEGSVLYYCLCVRDFIAHNSSPQVVV